MCGIAGKLSLDGRTPIDRAVLDRMAMAIEHRGPDDGGVWTGEGVGLVTRRLKVIDLSDRAHQPMVSEDGLVAVTFNGEIYNFRALRVDLEGRGVRFRSASDTEVLLHLYETHGDGCVQHLRGMFAFAIWDGRRRRLFAARDRIGKKPFFYLAGPRAFWFASEPKAFLQDPDVACEPDPEAIHHYLTFGYVPAPLSAFRGVCKLPPASTLVVEDGQVRVARYWSLRYQPKRTESEADLAQELRDRLQEAMRLRLISDVPLGVLLSGGVDSSAVVALMRREAAGPIRTFSIGFDEPEYDELDYARQVAARFETEHQELVVRPDAAALLPKLAWHYGEPFADSSAVPTYCLAEMARRSVTVALSGDGGDEVFLGYDRYAAAALARRYDWLPRGVRRAAAAAVGLLPRAPHKSNVTRVRRFAETLALDPVERYGRWIGMFSEAGKARLYDPAFAARVSAPASLSLLETLHRATDAEGEAEAFASVDVQTYLPDDLLVKTDIASMASSLEVRSPLLDHHVMELAASLPPGLKLRGLTGKHILRALFRDELPRDVLERRKMGFGVPIERWLRVELRAMAYDLLLDRTARARGYFRPEIVREWLDRHVQGRANHHSQLWTLLMLELWHRVHIDRRCAVRAADIIL